MRRRLLSFAALSAVLFGLAACDSGITVPLRFSDLSGPVTAKNALLYAQLPTCRESDTDLPSNALIEAQSRVPYVFPEAKFLACSEQDFDAQAQFSLPVLTGGSADDGCASDSLCLLNIDGNVSFVIGKGAAARMKALAESLTLVDLDGLRLSIRFMNDSGRELRMFVPSAWIGSSAFHNVSPKWPADFEEEIRLSDTATAALLEDGAVTAFVLTEEEAL